MPTVLNVAHLGPTRTSSIGGEDDEERSPNGFNTSGSSFTKKLYEILDSSESCDIVCWTQDGTAFEVKEPKRLELEILPKYFRHARFQSFVRQLNFYSFKKVSKERSSWIYSHECFQRNKPDLLDRLRRKTNTSTLPSGANVGGEKRMYEIYAASVGLQEHEMASTLKVLRGDNRDGTGGEGVYYYGQQQLGHTSSSHKQWGYEGEYQVRGTGPSDPYPSDGPHPPLTLQSTHHGRQTQAQAEYLETSGESNRLTQHMQSWESMRLVDQKAGRERGDRDREPSTTQAQAVSSLAFLYGATASHAALVLPPSSSALGSSSDGNRSPDSDDPSEAATDNSQSSGSLCGGKGGDRGSVSSVSLSSAEGQHKRSCHTHPHGQYNSSAQWQGGGYPHPDQASDPRGGGAKGPYQHYERDGYSSIYPAYLPQSRPHSSQHHQIGFRPPAPQHLLYSQQLHGHLQTQTQAQMMHARYLNYQQNVRQGQGREMAVPKVAPIVIPPSNYPSSCNSKAQPMAIATLMDDHTHWATKPLIVKHLSVSRDQYPGQLLESCAGTEGDGDSALSFARTKGTVMPILKGQAQAQAALSLKERDRGEDKYIVLMPPHDDRVLFALPSSCHFEKGVEGSDCPPSLSPSRYNSDEGLGLTRGSSIKARHDICDGEISDGLVYCPRMSPAPIGAAAASSSEGRSRGCTETEDCEGMGGGGNLVLDEPLGDATHALLSFCMQRNPWMYSQPPSLPIFLPQPSSEDGLGSTDKGDDAGSSSPLSQSGEPEGMQGLGPGPTALYKDVLSCLGDTPLLREELECYSEALNPSPFPQGARGHRRRSVQPAAVVESSSSSAYRGRDRERRRGRISTAQAHRSLECETTSSDDNESSEGDLTDDSEDSDEQLSVQARSLSSCNNMTRKRDAVEEMRAFTTFASLRMQEVCDLVCEQEARRAQRREQDRCSGLNHWALNRDGTLRDQAASAAAAAFVKALETCTQTWWAYANLYK